MEKNLQNRGGIIFKDAPDSSEHPKIQNKAAPESEPPKSKPGLDVLKTYNCELTSYGGNAACGVVINNTDKTMGYVQVEINIYD